MRRITLVALLLVSPAAEAGGLRRWVMGSFTPTGPFSSAEVPPPPDYRLPTSWSALPELDDLGDRTPPGLTAVAPQDARVDVFYVHPTSSVTKAWNAPADDPKLAVDTDRGGALIQASAFNGIGAIYAPRYRQANGTAFWTPTEDGERAIEIAYGDVSRAFDSFLARRTPGRPFLIAGHSQGGALAARLLVRRIAGTPLRDELVGAWILGTGLTHEGLAREAPDVPACASEVDTGCVVAWNARAPDHVADMVELYHPLGEHRVCTNPLSGLGEGGPMPASANLGAVFLQTARPVVLPGFADAACVDGTLLVNLHGKLPVNLPTKILLGVMGRGNHHPVEVELFWSNLRADAAARVEAWERAHQGSRSVTVP